MADVPMAAPTGSTSTPHKECFVSNRHAVLSLQNMESYFLKEQLTDVVLIAGKRRIPAHRLVLSAGSEYFAAMFTSDLKEASQNETELHDVDGDALWALIHYCYTGRIELLEDTVKTVLRTACLLQLNEVVEACCSFLKEQLDPSNCIGIGHFADSQGCTDLFEVSKKYTEEHFVEVVKNEEFLKLSVDEVSKLLASDDLAVSSEDDVFHALKSWLEFDLPNRKVHMNDLLTLVRFPLLSPTFMVKHIDRNPLFGNDPVCHQLMFEAFKYHVVPEYGGVVAPRSPRKSTAGDLYCVQFYREGPKDEIIFQKFDWKLDTWTISEVAISYFPDVDGRIVTEEYLISVIDGILYTLAYALAEQHPRLNCYDMKKKKSFRLPAFLHPRENSSFAVMEGLLYVIGGLHGCRSLNTVERYNPKTGKWSYVAPMLRRRWRGRVAVLKGKLYVVGGEGEGRLLREVECYDPQTNQWTACKPFSIYRQYFGVGVLKGFLYVVGGRSSVGETLSVVERYNPETDTWTEVASMNFCRKNVGVCGFGNKLFAVGGWAPYDKLRVVEAYDPVEDKWEEMAPLVHAVSEPLVALLKL